MKLLILLLLLAVLGFSYYAYRFAFYHVCNPDDPSYRLPSGEAYAPILPNLTKWAEEMYARPFEPVTITSHDGHQLFGRYYHVADGAPLEIQFHGYKSSVYIDFCGGSALAAKLGHNALVVDQRAHGKSGGHTISFGINERRDCVRWIAYANQRFDPETPIVLAGLSMGAATVLMASGEDLPANVKGIFADCPYSSPRAIIQKVSGDIHLPGKLAYPFVKLGAFLFGHFHLDECSAVSAVKKAKVPILLIHGAADDFVPCSMSQEIAEACVSQVKLVLVPGAGHGLSYTMEQVMYEEEVTAFMQEVLGNASMQEAL